MVFIEDGEQGSPTSTQRMQQGLKSAGHAVYKSNTVGVTPTESNGHQADAVPNGTTTTIAGRRSNTFGGATNAPPTQPSSPTSPFTAVSAISAQSHSSSQSYAHRRSVSGWDKLFTTISQRSATHDHERGKGGDHADLELRVPGIGEDALAHGDVQYVYESDENFGNGRNTFAHGSANQQQSRAGSYSHPTTPFAAIANRERSNTGASSTGSGLQFDHGPATSTTALSPAFKMAPIADHTDASRINNRLDNSGKLVGSFVEDKPSEHRHGHFPHLRNRKSSASMLGHREKTQHEPTHYGTGALLGRLFGPHDEGEGDGEGEVEGEGEADDDVHNESGGEDEADGEDNANKRKRMEDIRSKFKRAVVLASAITRKTPRSMKSAGARGVFPFLQDAMFVPMFHFMRDEHGHRAPPVIFDAIRLNVVVGGAVVGAEEEEQHSTVRIELQYGDAKWVIHRRLNDFLSLHTMLTLRKFKGRVAQLPAFPQQLSYALEKARSLKPGHSQHQSSRMQQATIDRKQALETYLLKLLRALNMRPAYEVCTFLELSAVSIVKDVGWKGKEGNMDRRVEHTTGMWCTPHDLRRWSRQWVLVRDSYIAFCNHISDPYPTDVLFADPQFDIKFRKKTGHNPLFPYRITISNEYRRIQLRSDSERIINEWRHSITEMKASSAWAQPHRFSSFAPIRDDSRVIWFVDGDDYFYAVSEALENATDCIYIMDWWLSPELHLRRPYALNEEYRIDRLLKRKAEEGIKIYVLVYKEVTVSLTINSAYTKRKLQSLHPNIMVQRHPDHLAGGTMFWAHHEKMVIVDNTFGFIGGLDLCWGRYDTHGHRLADYFLPYKGRPFSHLQNFFGQDYNNARIHDFANVNDYEDTLIDRRTTPRMPWHDVHMAMIGQPTRDIARHFIQRWNFIKSSKGMAKTHMPFLMPKGEYSATRNDLQYRGSCRTQLLRSSAEWSLGITKESSIHTAYCEMIRNAKHFIYIENQFFVSNAREDPNYTIKNRIAEALVDRVKRAHKRGERFRVFIIIPLMPAFEGDVNAMGAATLKLVMHWQYQSICRGDHSIASQLDKEGIDMHDYIRFFGLRTYDVIRRYADGSVAQDVNALAGNAPQEVPGFEQLLQKQGVPTIERSVKAEEAEPVAAPNVHVVGPPHATPPEEGSLKAATIANHSIHGGAVPAPPASLSFNSPGASIAAVAGEYSFRRPDEAFAADAFPMQDNPARVSREMSRRSQDHQSAIAESTAGSQHHHHLFHHHHHNHQQKQQQQQQTAGRRSFNLPRKTLPRQRSSFSGLRGFFMGDRDSNRQGEAESKHSSHRSRSSSCSSSENEEDYSYDDDHEGEPRMHYSQRIDKEGRRRTAFRYLLRGTEHIKHYGKPRIPGRQQTKTSGTAGQKLHKRLHKYGIADLERRDSDSEFTNSNVHVDLADVDNYVHPPKVHGRTPKDAAFLGDQQEGRSVERTQPTVLPEFSGAEYLRERQLVDSGDISDIRRLAGEVADVDQATRQSHRSSKTGTYSGNSQTSRAKAAAGKIISDITSSTSVYPPAPAPRSGPQVMEHEVFGRKRQSDNIEQRPSQGKRQMESQSPPIARHTAQAEPGTMNTQPKMADEAPEIVHIEPEIIDQIVTELVYVHCKLMIVDDRYVVMGSANINDRSMVGNRDSEVAMVIEDSQPVVTTMNGRPYQAARFAHSLRIQLCQEHSGLLGSVDQMRYVYEMFGGSPPVDTKRSDAELQQIKRNRKIVEDPLSDEFQEFWWSVASRNEELFRDVFRCVPDNTIETFDQYKKFIPGPEVPHGHALPSRSTAETLELLKGVRGHLVPMPLNFLKNENLGAKLGDKELLVPVEVFT
ncbi:hypothetical protein IW140_001438 [Coemansia sp. RSA 1813]|nr:hypothetical protein LPJ74_005866 [Coemansia sp. RSA 1843]KAJ2091810.1 hypothetical protein IW138_001499 [Coemansia sp. RSA 986]KAJ2215863.1 hypothetical protein EV179_001883 [Coemansia sp. RSA 487]KAJ2571797.1 hypothetical protein IW140_001438 [Coemansia sp. RSA 1813]